MVYFTQLLTEAREKKNMTKAQVAAQMGWTPMYYGRYENGYLLPTSTNMRRFAEFIGIQEKELSKIVETNRANPRNKSND